MDFSILETSDIIRALGTLALENLALEKALSLRPEAPAEPEAVKHRLPRRRAIQPVADIAAHRLMHEDAPPGA